ncbi:transposase [Magnetococcus sp. PR-3]|uniref:transposase n=1 Tax=Magnetococcus sp. PR-3 TaxID=3120355 RepID=UPI003FA56583
MAFFDESGFEDAVCRQHAWARRGKKLFGERPGRKHNRTNLILAQRVGEWLALVVFHFSCNAELG